MRVFFAIVLVSIFFSCTKDDNLDDVPDFTLKVEVLGSGCGTTKMMSITERQTKVFYVGGYCKEKDSSSTYSTDLEKLTLLKNKLEELNFKELNISECFRCLDGIDYKMTLDENGMVYTNTIAYRYDKEGMTTKDRKLKELQDLIDSF